MTKTFHFQPHENGLLPAVPHGKTENKDMEGYWIRDNYWVWRNGFHRESIAKAFVNIFDRYEKLIEQQEVFPVRFDEGYEQNKEWGNFQVDSYANLLEVLAVHGYTERAEKMRKHVLKNVSQKDRSIWEEREDYHPYTFGCVARALSKLSEVSDKVSQHQVEGYEDVAIVLMKQGRPDLQNLFLPLLRKRFYDVRCDIVANTSCLLGRKGVRRYKYDKWDGVSHSLRGTNKHGVEWILGYLAMMEYLPYYPLDKGYGEDVLGAVNEIHYEVGEEGLPESFYSVTGEPNSNQPLIWAEAMYHGDLDG